MNTKGRQNAANAQSRQATLIGFSILEGKGRQLCQRCSRATGRNPPPWRSRREDTSASPNRGDTARSFPRLRPATASPSSPSSSPVVRKPATNMPRRLRKRLPRTQTALPCSSCTICAGRFSRSTGSPTSISGHLRHRLRQVHRGCCGSLLGHRHSHCLRISRRLP